ncbi:MAG: hypothetical protein JWO15_3580 [Sphingomonadales bacterium]|nr:hypothetical protein [Sphingomonadales bacterium]
MSNVKLVNGQVVAGEFKAVSRDFAIKQSAHAIHVLSTSLYSRPIEAIVRELSCNALDAHMAACTTNVPFEVRLQEEMYTNSKGELAYGKFFSVRDYGTGMAPEDLERLYTTYFDSTKQQGDGFIGSFGLGSKSPFAYTKKFTIKDHYFGMVYEYVAEVDEDTHIPSLTKTGETPTDELANGIEIKFQITNDKIGEFKDASLKVLRFFGDSVVLKGNLWGWHDSWDAKRSGVVDIDSEPNTWRLLPPETAIDLPSVFVRKEQYYGEDNGGSAHVLLNNVVYRLDLSRFEQIPEVIRKTNFILRMPVGSIDVTPSREELHYSKRTVASLTTAMETAAADVSAFVQNLLSALSDYELRQQYHLLRQQFGSNVIPDRYVRNDIAFRSSNRYGVIEHKVWSKRRVYRRGTEELKITEAEESTIAYGPDLEKTMHVILQSETDRPKSRIHEFMANIGENAVVRSFKNQAEFDQYLSETMLPAGKYRSIKLCDMPKPARAPRAKRGTAPKAHKVFQQYSGGEYGGSWTGVTVNVDEVENAVYIPIMHWQAMVAGTKRDPISVIRCIKEYTNDYTFYGIKMADVEEFAKLENWISIDDLLQECAEEICNSLHGKTLYTGRCNKVDVLNLLQLKTVPGLTTVECLQNFHYVREANLTLKKQYDKLQNLAQYLPHSDTKRNADVKTNEWSEVLQPIDAQFPMLGLYLEEKTYLNEREKPAIRAVVIQYLLDQVKLHGVNGERHE